MSLNEWLINQFGISLMDCGGIAGAQLADAMCHALGEKGVDYGRQADALLEACNLYTDVEFGEECMLLVERLERLQRHRRDALERNKAQCQNGGAGRREWPVAGEVAMMRFRPLRETDDMMANIVDDMLRKLVAAGYIESNAEALRDLRQGLGYYRSGEDPFRMRRPVRWLQGQNTLHYWLCLLLEGERPLIGVVSNTKGRWVTAASLFTDSKGRAFTSDRLEHGKVSRREERQLLESTVPRLS